MSSNEYLTRVNLMDAAIKIPTSCAYGWQKCCVMGDGNTAMDSCSYNSSFGRQKRAMIVYRHSEEEMPARLEEVKHAKKSQFIYDLHNLVLDSMETKRACKTNVVQKWNLRPDASGRKPIGNKRSNKLIDVDLVMAKVLGFS